MAQRPFALFDPASRLNRLRAGTRPEDRLRGYFHWLALQKQTDGGARPTPANRPPAFRVFAAGDPERSLAAELRLDFVPGEDGERRLALAVRLRDRKDFPRQEVACRVYLLEQTVLRRLAERARARASGERPGTAAAGPATARLHAGPVRALAALPDGRVVSGGADGTLRLWDPAAGTVATFASGYPDVVALAALPDGRVVSADAHGALRLWDVGTGAGRDLPGPRGRVTALAVLPDGRIASAVAGGPIRLWNPGTGAARTLELRRGVEALAPLPGGRLLSIDAAGMAQVWDLATGAAHTAVWRRHGRFLAALPDGRAVMQGSDGTLHAWNPVTGAEQTVDAPAGDGPAAALSDGRLAVAAADGTVSVSPLPAPTAPAAPAFLPAAFDDGLLAGDFEAARILSAIPEVEGTLDAHGCGRLAQPAVPGGEPAVTADDLTGRVFFAVVLDR
jgi:WD40 repeat protein